MSHSIPLATTLLANATPVADHLLITRHNSRPSEGYFGATGDGLWDTASAGDECPVPFDTGPSTLLAGAKMSDFPQWR